MDLEATAREETHRILEALRRLIRSSGLSQRKVEKVVGFSKGYLSQLFAHNLDLKYWHVVAVLQALDYPARRFFAELYAGRPRPSALETFQRSSPPAAELLGGELEELYGPEAIEELQSRVERCEKALAQLERRGVLEGF